MSSELIEIFFLPSLIFFLSFLFILIARSISDDLSSGDAARFRDEEYGKSESVSGMGGATARNESAHKGERDKEKKEKDKEDFEGNNFYFSC